MGRTARSNPEQCTPAGCYPEIVALAGLLLPPYGQGLAANRTHHDGLVTEIGRRRDSPGYTVSVSDPLYTGCHCR